MIRTVDHLLFSNPVIVRKKFNNSPLKKLRMETYKTSQKTVKALIAYKNRADGTPYTYAEKNRNIGANQHYEEWDANDNICGKLVYNELIPLNSAESYIRENSDNILWANVYFIDIPRNKEYFVYKWENGRFTKKAEFVLRKVPPVAVNPSYPDANPNVKVYVIWDKVLDIKERRVVELPVTKYKNASQQVQYETFKESVTNSIPKFR